MINDNLDEFCGKTVIDFNSEEGIKGLDNCVYRLRLDYEALDEGANMGELIEAFAETPVAATVQELIIGQWSNDGSNDAVVEKLVEFKDTFKHLKALFIGDITSEESEISWIQQSDLSPILAAYPNLEILQIRGGNELSLSELNHENLKMLVIQTGGLPPNVVTEVSNAHLPNLEHLELWLGDENYGFESTVEDFDTIINGGKFPKLRHLGLQNSIIQDEIAIKVAESSILDQLEVLDLSMGILTDKGATALLESSKIRQLKSLNLDHHFMSNEMMTKLKDLHIDVSMDAQMDAQMDDDEEYRFIAVSE